jgi:hypothetical protein
MGTATATTERDWLRATSIMPLWYSRYARDDRKRRLVACACARRLLPMLTNDPRPLAVIDAVEALAEVPAKAVPARWQAALAAKRGMRVMFAEARSESTSLQQFYAMRAIDAIVQRKASGVADAFRWAHHASARRRLTPGLTEGAAQTMIFREVFGNPFRPVAFDPAWRTPTVTALAQTMYESRDFAAMPILADALQDADCDSDDILDHCRDPKQVHVRGCWVVDLVLGKA